VERVFVGFGRGAVRYKRKGGGGFGTADDDIKEKNDVGIEL
jgi:hypothetical protein